ncbi:acyl-CoA N-acyltransferase [Sporodiniella umbellata]|nr:acyl-CoA N-acyltransferase [Sporodiniella umbellata]
MGYTLITANEEHAELLTKIGKKTFEETYAEDNTGDDMKNYLNKAFSLSQVTEELNDPKKTTFILMENDLPIGYAQLAETKDIYDCVTDREATELKRIYVEKKYIGTGVGKRLMVQLLAETKKKKNTIWLGVWKKNELALKFYKDFGFKIVGERVFKLGKKEGSDWVMIKKLDE